MEMHIFMDCKKGFVSIASAAAFAFVISCSANNGSTEECSPEKALDEYYSGVIAERLAEKENSREELAEIVPNMISLEVKDKRKTREGCELTFTLTLESRIQPDGVNMTKDKKAEMIQEGEHWRVKRITDL